MPPQTRIDTSRPHPARVYDYMLGGKDHYPVDQELGERLPAFLRTGAQQNRAFMRRAVAQAARAGIRQFLDIGTGIPTEPNLHQIAQRVAPKARVVYADYDPIVLRHAEALLVSAPEGATDYIQADVREPDGILDHARSFLDFEQPVALSLIALLHFVVDAEDPYGIVRTLVAALPSGSRLILSHASLERFPDSTSELASTYASRISSQSRTREEVARFFDGLDLVAPGVVTAPEWHQDDADAPEPSAVYVGVARKP
ncbi:SAM-dependent methyltransferase [Streptomyces sp. NRRL F-5126]|uniref:SAM-dependent methyltransferase n=1 Tax=Streptomyces sp. NRRL F-5126 TaxID=1463857 RepID=UPI0004C78F1D|nr:SAM-dependent methyltransferase [Streptomyces sp. NRRL F-5126]